MFPLSGVLANTNSNSGNASTKSCMPCCDASPEAESPPPCSARIFIDVGLGTLGTHPTSFTDSPGNVFGHSSRLSVTPSPSESF